MTDFVRYCPNCHLPYRPDPRIHRDPHEFCPRCGFDLSKAKELKEKKISRRLVR